MQDNGPLIALVFFAILAIVFGLLVVVQYGDFSDETRKAELSKLEDDIAKTDDETRAKEDERAAKMQDLRFQEDRAEYFDRLASELRVTYDLRQSALGEKDKEKPTGAKAYIADANKLSAQIKERSEKSAKTMDEKKAEIKATGDAQLANLDEKKAAVAERMRLEKEKMDKEVNEHTARMSSQRNLRDDLKRQLDQLAVRQAERSTLLEEPDGTVVRADPVSNTVVINIGTLDGVRNGYRFEAFSLTPDRKKVSKGYIEVRNAGPDLSECFIIVKDVKLPTDPLSDYVASSPEEKFSPYREAGRKGAAIQPLSGPPRVVRWGDQSKNPIQSGDFVENPFFRKGPPLNFYLAGNKELAGGIPKCTIAYPWTQIKRVAESYGAKVADKVDPTLDCVIAQRNPTEDPKYLEAVRLGVPVLYEWELFRFIDQN